MNEVKSGVRTTEFYMPAIVAALGLLVSLGLLTTELADNLVAAIAAAVPAAVGLIGAVLATVEYIKSRTIVKEAAILAQAGEIEALRDRFGPQAAEVQAHALRERYGRKE